MQTFSRAYDSYAQAERAVRDLETAGVSSADISLMANRHATGVYATADGPSAAASGAGFGAALGGGAGLLAVLGVIAVPGIGPVVAAGWLAATAVGAVAGSATGGIIGALIEAGSSEADANVYSEAVRRGGSLVTVRTDFPVEQVTAILDRHQPVDPAQRRREYEQAGWQGFDPKAPYDKPSKTEVERIQRPTDQAG